MKETVFLYLGLLVLSAITLYTPEKPVDLRIGVLKTVDTVHPFIAADQKYFENENITYKIFTFGTSPALAEAFQAGEIDVAYMSVAPAAIWISKGTPIKILAGASRGGDVVCVVNSTTSSGEMAVSNKGTMTEILYSSFVKDKMNFEPIYGVEPADMATALLVTKDVDAVLTAEPFATQIENNGGRCVMDVGEAWQKQYGIKYQRTVLVATDKVFSNKALLDKILRINNKTIGFLNTPESDKPISKIMNIVQFKRRADYNETLEWDSINKILAAAKNGGYLKKDLTKEELISKNS